MSLLLSPTHEVAPEGLTSGTVVWAIGPWQATEFRAARDGIVACEGWAYFPDCAAAQASLATEQPGPELILVAQPLPGRTLQLEIDNLLRAAPLSRIVLVAGSWCEGELRTGRPPAGVARLYWYELSGWWLAAQRGIACGQSPPWSSPPDSALTRRNSALEVGQNVLPLGHIAIDCMSWATFDSLAGALQPHGWVCHWRRDNSFAQQTGPFAAGIWDGGQLDADELPQLQQFAQLVRQRGGHTLVLLDFPRREHTEMIQHAGGSALLGKPYIVSEMAALLQSLT